MKKVEQWRSWTFIGSLALIAIIVNGVNGPQRKERSIPTPPVEQSRQSVQRESNHSDVPREKTPQELAAERALFQSRYMNDRPARRSGIQTVGIVAVSGNGTLNRTLAGILAEHVKGDGIQTHTFLFTPEFISDGLFKAVFDDSPKPIEDLELREVLDSLLLAQETVEYTINPSLENVITASLLLEIKLASIARRGESQSWKFIANGAGFTEALALKAAEERLIKQLSADTNVTVSANP